MSETFIKLIITWLPFIILIGVWIFFMNRMRGGTTWQKSCLDEMKAQTEAQQKIIGHLDRIAIALEQRKP